MGAPKVAVGGIPPHRGKPTRPGGVDRLTDAACRNARPDAGSIRKLADGKGLYLAVLPSGVKSWRVKYRHDGKERTYTIGTYDEIGLARARQERDKARDWLRSGLDPTTQKKAVRAITVDAQAKTFRAVALEYLTAQTFTPQHVEALNRILDRDLYPDLGALPVAQITTPQVLDVLRRIEARGQLETCAKARRLASAIFRYAINTGKAPTDPAATLARGVLKPPVVTNRVTVPLKEFPSLLKALAKVPAEANTKLACYFTLLTACRVGEMRLATWGEVERDQLVIPAARMKMRRDHVVPLSIQAKRVLEAARLLRTSDDDDALLFPGFTRHGALSENALIALLARCGFYGRQTAHGFRAAFSTWAHESAEADPDVIELCLAHKVPGVRGDYNRALYRKQRRELLQAWADQLSTWGMAIP